MIDVKLYQEMRKIAGASSIQIEMNKKQKVGEILEELVNRYPAMKGKIFDEKGKLNSYINVFINGRNVMTKEGLDTLIQEGDRVALFPPLGGG